MVAKNQQGNASEGPSTDAEESASRKLSMGVRLGRAAEKLAELDISERDALARSPDEIRNAHAKKREEVLSQFSPDQREGLLLLAKTMSGGVDPE